MAVTSGSCGRREDVPQFERFLQKPREFRAVNNQLRSLDELEPPQALIGFIRKDSET